MSSKCAREQCTRSLHVLCYICGENLCREHFNEHDHSLNSLLKSFNDQVNDLDQRLDLLNNEELIENSYDKLDQWREQSHQIIDQFYQKKCRELQQRFQENFQENHQNIEQIQSHIQQLLQEENPSRADVVALKGDVNHLGDQIDQLEKTIFQVEIQPLELSKDFIQIQMINQTVFQLKQISNPFLTINFPKKFSKPIASNEQFLLIYQLDHLALLDQQFHFTQQIPWNYGRIWDITFSPILNSFLIVGHYQIYIFNPQTKSIQIMENISRLNWWACTSSDKSLFLSTYDQGSTIVEYQLHPTIQMKNQWKSPLTCTKEESIKDLISKSDKLGLTIFNQKNFMKRFELRSLNELAILWVFQIDIPGSCHNTLRCCSLNADEWLIADFDHRQLIHLNPNGQLKKLYPYNFSPWYIHLFHQNILVISTRKSLHFHQL